MDYLNFVIEHAPKKKIKDPLTLFEKVLLASKRARDLEENKTPTGVELTKHKHTTVALYETLHNKIDPVLHIPKYADIDDDEDDEEEDDIEPAV